MIDLPTKIHRRVSVRDLVEFTRDKGNLGGLGQYRSQRRALDGSKGHREIQGKRPSGYQREVAVQDTAESARHFLSVQGRIDGLLASGSGVLLEEIKTVLRDWSGEPHPLHWAQAKCYGAIFGSQSRLENIDLQLTYLNLDTNDLAVFRRSFVVADLLADYQALRQIYLDWLEALADRAERRDISLRGLPFPFESKRRGQEELMEHCQAAFRDGGTLLAEAPTGIGKTVSVLSAAARSLGAGQVDRVLYLTAKTLGAEAAAKACADLRAVGLRWRGLCLSARDRVCFGEGGAPCDPTTCPFAIGYHERRMEAMRAALDQPWLDFAELRRLAQAKQVCPFALSMDLAPWVDILVCDYNYLFDPQVRLRDLADESGGRTALLIDEAHNLPDRARRSYSAEIRLGQVQALARSLRPAPSLRRASEELVKTLAGTEDGPLEQMPGDLRAATANFTREADAWLSRREEAPFREALMECYFAVTTFLRLLELGGPETHRLVCRAAEGQLHWLCLDPAPYIRDLVKAVGPTIFFSATLTPLAYHQRMFGCAPGAPELSLPSPFPPERFGLSVHTGIATTYRERARTHHEVAEVLGHFVRARSGNYLLFFSSYDYLQAVLERLRPIGESLGWQLMEQRPAMGLAERDDFLREFANPRRGRTLVGLAVLGGLFGEAIDLVGEKLLGVAVVGVGLPAVSWENELLREHFASLADGGEQGFDYAYTYPGFNRVLQAVGRLLRSEQDRGAALLIDKRYRQSRYEALFPNWWQPRFLDSGEDLAARQRAFWR